MGRHQPPTNRSFYLSVAASTLRLALIVALVVGGIALINRAFPEATGTGAAPGGGVVVTESPSPSPTEDDSPSPTPSPTVTGTQIAVFNGTAVTGLAADTLDRLIERFGYEAGQEAADAPSPFSVTTVYFRSPSEDRIEAEHLANVFFRRLDDVVVARLPANADVDQSVQVAVYLGTDYATLRAGQDG